MPRSRNHRPSRRPAPSPRRAERRRARRRSPRNSRLRSPALEVRLLDLSDEGLAIESREALRIGARYRFSLEGEPGRGAPFEGEVLWCWLTRTEKGDGDDVHAVFRAGIRRLR